MIIEDKGKPITFDKVRPGEVFKYKEDTEDNTYICVEDDNISSSTTNAFNLKDGKPFAFDPDDEVFLFRSARVVLY